MVRERVALASMFVLLALPLSAQSVRLNGRLAQPGASDVLEGYRFTSDGARIVFRANTLDPDVFELYSAPADAGAAALRLAPGADVTSLALGAGDRVLYVADASGTGVLELFQVPVAGGVAPIRLSGALVANGDVVSFQLTPDGSRALFLADKLVDGRDELFSVPIDGSAAPVQLDPAFPAGDGDVTHSWISPDGARVLFARTRSFTERLWSVPITGGANALLLLKAPAIGDGSFHDLRFTTSGQGAACVTLDEVDGDVFLTFLFALAVDGSTAPVQLVAQDYEPPPYAAGAGERVVYTDGTDLFSVVTDGSQLVRLDPPLHRPTALALTPDGATVVFRSVTNNLGTLLRAPIAGGPVSTLAGTVADVHQFELGIPGEVLYLAGTGLFAVPFDGSAPPLFLSGSGLTVSSGFEPLSNGSAVVFVGTRPGLVRELYAVPVDASAPPLRVSAALDSSSLQSFAVAPGGARAAYLADQTHRSTFELLSTPLATGSPQVPYIDVPAADVIGDVADFRVLPDRKTVVYRALEDRDPLIVLHIVSTESPGTSFTVGGWGAPDWDVDARGERVFQRPLYASSAAGELRTSRIEPGSGLQVVDTLVMPPVRTSPDGARVVYREGLHSPFELLSKPLEGPGAAVRLCPQLTAGHNVTDFEISPDSRTVVYLAEQNVALRFELFTVPIDGSAPALRLSGPLSAGRDVVAFRIRADEGGVVYLADQEVDERFELYEAPLDAGSPPLKLSPALDAGEDVVDFRLAPGGTRVVFRADAATDERFDLYSVLLVDLPRSGTFHSRPLAVRRRLTSLAGTQAVQPDYEISSDGRVVVYRADVQAPGTLGLFAVPIDGSAAPVPIGPAAGESAVSFHVSPDSTRVVYLAQRADDLFELRSVPITGGSAVTLDLLPAFASVDAYQIAPDSRDVVFRADRATAGVMELFGVPLDGSAPPQRLNAGLLPAGSVEPDFVALPGGRALYRADQEEDEVFELFLGALRPAFAQR